MKFILALSVPVIGTIGNVLLKMGMTQVGPVTWAQLQSPLPLIVSVSRNPFISFALALYIVGFIVWLIVLSRFDLSYTFPLLALVYILVPLTSWAVLGERIPIFRWMGIFIILVGLIVVGWPD